jgi:hypothetical protein
MEVAPDAEDGDILRNVGYQLHIDTTAQPRIRCCKNSYIVYNLYRLVSYLLKDVICRVSLEEVRNVSEVDFSFLIHTQITLTNVSVS